jgi:hypothetical protein
MSGNDISEIVNVLNLYAIAVDTLQWDLFDRVFTPDARLDYLSRVWDDLTEFKKHFAAVHAPLDSSQHMVTNHQVVVNGDRANALSYARARLIRSMPEGGGNQWEIGAWYDDVLVRTPRGWRIKSRTCRGNWWDGNIRVSETTSGSARQEMTLLRRAAAAGEISHLDAVRGQ